MKHFCLTLIPLTLFSINGLSQTERLPNESAENFATPKSRQGFWLGVGIALFVIITVIGTFGTIGGVILFGNKNTEEYKCAISEIKKNKEVLNLLGEPIEAGWFAPGDFSLKYSERTVSFITSINGSKGSAMLSVESFRNPIGSKFKMSLSKDGQEITLHNGTYPCQ